MTIRMILACDNQGVIGVDGKIPWKMRSDMRLFKEMTSGNTVIMGRKTFQSMGCKALPNRLNIVLTRDKAAWGAEQYEDQEVKGEHGGLLIVEQDDMCGHTLLADLGGYFPFTYQIPGDVYVIGGEEIYRVMAPTCEEVILTQIDCHAATAFASEVAKVNVYELLFEAGLVVPDCQIGHTTPYQAELTRLDVEAHDCEIIRVIQANPHNGDQHDALVYRFRRRGAGG